MAMWPSAGQFGIDKTQSKLAWSRTKRMMQNRHQWEVRDLRKAGLNPILSAGAAPSMGTPPQPARSPDLVKGAMLKSQIALNNAGAANQNSQAGFNRAKTGVIAVPSRVGGIGGGAMDWTEDLLRSIAPNVIGNAKATGGAAAKAAQAWINKQTRGKPIEIYPKKRGK